MLLGQAGSKRCKPALPSPSFGIGLIMVLPEEGGFVNPKSLG
jgi:hypothetical protein